MGNAVHTISLVCEPRSHIFCSLWTLWSHNTFFFWVADMITSSITLLVQWLCLTTRHVATWLRLTVTGRYIKWFFTISSGTTRSNCEQQRLDAHLAYWAFISDMLAHHCQTHTAEREHRDRTVDECTVTPLGFRPFFGSAKWWAKYLVLSGLPDVWLFKPNSSEICCVYLMVVVLAGKVAYSWLVWHWEQTKRMSWKQLKCFNIDWYRYKREIWYLKDVCWGKSSMPFITYVLQSSSLDFVGVTLRNYTWHR